ncbi:hypothetical protein HK098_004392 [Nowakowskiella sp. JEL0407]|nr:hypothetical protein HK098_004392 [Nowakowskiella sp. JEL0407]
MLVSILFSIINFNSLIQPSSGLRLLVWTNDEQAGIELWRRVIMTFSGIASFSGVLSVVLTAKGKYSCFFWGIINSAVYGLFAFAYGYAGDAQLNVFFFLPMQFVGLWAWHNSLDDENTAKARSLNLLQWVGALLLLTGCVFAFYFEIPVFAKAIAGSYVFEGNNTPRALDACTNGLNIVAQILLLGRFWEQWIFWLSVNILQIIMYAGIAGFGFSFNVVVMWSFFLVNSVYGLYTWIKRWRSADDRITDPEQDGADKEHATLINTAEHSSYSLTAARDLDLKWKHGVVIGKFYPPHKGHHYLMNTAISFCTKKLTIFVCDAIGRVPNANIRKEWIESWFKDVTDINVEVFVKSEDGKDPTDSELWANLTREWLNGVSPDVVFTSEDYGETYAKFLGCSHVLVDRNRMTFPISATQVRQNALQVWDMLDENVRSFFSIRIIIVGSESTGKTTMAENLSTMLSKESKRLFGETTAIPWVQEYGREVTEKKMTQGVSLEELETSWDTATFEDIVVEQARRENTLARTSKIVVCDTDALATTIWYERYCIETTDSPPTTGDFLKIGNLAQAQYDHRFEENTFYVLCRLSGSEFVQDGTRDGTDQVRKWMEDKFLAKLTERNAKFISVDGNWTERTSKASEGVMEFVKSRLV